LYPIIRNPSVNHSGAPHDSIRIGICGRIAEWKGQLFAIQALEHLLSTSDHIVLEILGSPLFGDDEYFERIKNFIVDRDLSKKVILLPFQESPENIVASWDFAIHSSILPEPFGRTVVESLMVGVPVIVPDTGGPSEIVSDGENGLTYKIADSQDLYLKVCQLVENPLLVNELQLNSKTIYSSFNSKMQVESFESWLGVFTK
jgi:glycosyltransferase involved in cell wall biosynthesis